MKNIPAPFGATPDENQYEHLKMGMKAFFHFGVNTFTNLEWGHGDESEKAFSPTGMDIPGWIRTAKAAGFRLCILTAKHHDGFCLWRSAYTDHTIKNSPYKNGEGDIVREFTDACHAEGMAVGLYVSPWDRHSPYWGKPEYSEVYAKQLTELMTGYGRIDEVWWDGAGSTETKYDWDLWADIIHKNQPHAVIFGSLGATPYVTMRWVGNEAGFADPTHYSSIDNESLYKEDRTVLLTGKIGGERFIPAEVDVSIRPGWFYHEEQDGAVKTPEEINRIWFSSVGRNSIMLLNFPPDRAGRIHPRDAENAIESHRQISRMLATDFALGARVTSDSTFSSDTLATAATDGDGDTFFAAGEGRREATLDITLETPTEANVLILGEEVRLGERITSFTLLALDGETYTEICSGTSVGYLRALIIPRGVYKNLRLHIEGVAEPTLRRFSLHLFEGSIVSPGLLGKENIMNKSTATVELSDDRKCAVLNFGGIYPFSTVSFSTQDRCGYELYIFDGSKFHLADKGVTENIRGEIILPEIVSDAYQIKLITTLPLNECPDFSVM